MRRPSPAIVITIIAWQIIIIQPTSVVFGFEQFSLQFLFVLETPKTVHRLKNIILIIQPSLSELYTEILVTISDPHLILDDIGIDGVIARKDVSLNHLT